MPKLTLRSGDREFAVDIQGQDIRVDGALVEAPPRAYAIADGDTRWVFLDGQVVEFEVQRRGRRRRAAHHHGTLSSPMPAMVVRINAAPGAQVKKGATLLVLEAMKMELPIRATEDGIVSAVNCRVGELVPAGVSLVEID